MSEIRRKPRIGITAGDPAGIGPEIVTKALNDPLIMEICEPVVFGMTEPGKIAAAGIEIGKTSAAGGKAAFESIEKAVQAARNGEIDAIATAPINKESLKAAGVPYIGHTEILAGLTGSDDPLTLFETLSLRVFFPEPPCFIEGSVQPCHRRKNLPLSCPLQPGLESRARNCRSIDRSRRA